MQGFWRRKFAMGEDQLKVFEAECERVRSPARKPERGLTSAVAESLTQSAQRRNRTRKLLSSLERRPLSLSVRRPLRMPLRKQLRRPLPDPPIRQ